jgi:acetyl esterase
MPIDPFIADRLPLPEGIESFEEAFGDPEQRERLNRFTGHTASYLSPPVVVRVDTASGPHGDIPVRIYRPAAAGPPVVGVVWMHGGAFVGGNLDMPEADIVARELAHRANAVVVSVDYRLAVDGVSYPVPHDDVVAAFRWVAAHADTLGVDPQRLVMGGASAGANLAAGAALRLRDEGDEVTPRRLLLAYPCVHASLPEASAELAAKAVEVPRALRFLPQDVDRMNAKYLGGRAGEVPGYAMPAHADLAGLPHDDRQQRV